MKDEFPERPHTLPVMKAGGRTVLSIGAVFLGTAILLLSGCAATSSSSRMPPAASSSAPPESRSSTPTASPPLSEGSVEVLDTVTGPPPDYADFSLPGGHSPVPLAFTDPDDVGVLWISTWGSSTCPSIPATYSVAAPGNLIVTLETDRRWPAPSSDTEHPQSTPPPDSHPCTDDNSLTSTAIALPDDVDSSFGITIQEMTTVTIPVRPFASH